jgi:hypothetical protein
MNTKGTSPIHSRQTSVTPYSYSLQRNGYSSYATSSTLCASLSKKTTFLPNNDSTEKIEMQVLANQQKTLEAFHELENLVTNGVVGRASIVRMSSIIQDQDDTIIETPVQKENSTMT